MTNRIKSFASVCLVSGSVLAGCESNDGLGAVDNTPPVIPTYVERYVEKASEWYLVWGETGYTLVEDLPLDSAHYKGIAVLSVIGVVENPDTYLGEVDLTVNFSDPDQDVVGTINEFRVIRFDSAVEEVVDGSFEVNADSATFGNNTALDAAFGATADGNLDSMDDTLVIEGFVVGANGENVQLILEGTTFSGDGFGTAQ